MEDGKRLVDVLIPTYKPGKRFGQLLDRLYRQKYPINQLIIINTEQAFWNPQWEAGRENKPALLCSGAMFAMDIVGAVRQHGYYAPEDYGIMAFDGIEEYQSWSPRLTSLDNHVEKMGFEAGDLVIRMIRGEASERRIVIPHNIVEGQTL